MENSKTKKVEYQKLLGELRSSVPMDVIMPCSISLFYLNKINKDGINNEKSKRLTKCAKELLSVYINSIEFIDEMVDRFDSNDFDWSSLQVLFNNIFRSAGMRMMHTVSTPKQICELVCSLLEITYHDSVFDMGSGYGDFLATAVEYSKHNGNMCKAIGQDIVKNNTDTSEMLLELIGVTNEISTVDSLLQEQIPNYTKGFVFPPFGMRYGNDYTATFNSEYGELFSLRTSSEWMFVVKAINGIKKGSRFIALLPDGALFQSAGKQIRKYLIDNKMLEGVIALPSGMLPFTNIPTNLLIIGSSSTFKLLDANSLSTKPMKRMNDVTIDVDEVVKAYKTANTFSEKDAIDHDYNLTVNYYLEKDYKSDIISPTVIHEVAEIVTGTQYTISHFKDIISVKPTKYQLLTSSNIENGTIDYGTMDYVNCDPKLLKFELRENDIVVTTKSTKVKIAVAKNLPARHIIVTGGMIIVRPNMDRINSTYLKMFLDSEMGQAQMSKIQKGVTITTMSPKDFNEMVIACPPLNEQNDLAAKYEQQLSIYNGLKQQLKTMEIELQSMYTESVRKDD